GTPINPNGTKTAFDQHYALLGISAYVEATDDSLSWQWLETGYTSLESHLWDSRPQYFGYYDHGNRSWSSVSGKSFNATVDALTTHLLYLYLMTENPGYLNRLLELGDNILNHLVASMDAQAIGFVERYDSDWNWDNSETMTIMGHVLKAAWSLARLYQLQPDTLYTQGASKLIEDVLLNGYDHEFGGPYKDFNRITGEMLMWGIPDTAKAWWQMEQAVTAGLQMYDITGDTLYLNMADETLDFFMHYFVDHTYGEVYADRTRYGDPIPQWGDNKGNGWKAGYHSIELGYYVYLYGKLFLHQQPVTLHYKFLPSSQERQIHLNPLAIADNELQIASVLKDGQTYGNFDPIQRILTIPPGTGGHFEVTYQRAPSFIAENNATFKPETFTLKQNYPNPFNPVTTIEFYLSHATHLTLHIYDVAGRKVKTLVNGYYPAGNYAVQWDATDAEGEKVSAGVYLYQMNSGNEAMTRKMVLLK
ncbi:MAG: T9SS C-terminal target domain-containing protein, partial [Methanobacteriota archaeon]